ncbi:threonine synthase [Candidatus Peregrinibacteria bacterium RIFOXYC2_FULL_33_13]|nr:MAG: hypothetical protein UR27_C0001G0038 [Candidatus Peregrinibacteria bacterium GW2011_GWA2_33_10]KKP39768.1 MAG: hypothetical protein UR30_C0008G0037 [Candidatus Peregrinibacteria bacterium GW2011_GWC2_33_13]OGJ53035.1 MAG: threonine synthase [Candidatus Peregrinibacteria bacterium RIFOXYC2_FULL_33_13]
MPTKFYKLQCVSCKTDFDESQTVTTCLNCGDSLDVIYDYNRIKTRLNNFSLRKAPLSAMKYADFYPIMDFEKIVTLKEGGTPLYTTSNLAKKYKLKDVYVKNEGANPTGVFKDRGTLVEITKALEMNAKAICLASSGNMAASAAAYASLARIPCYVLVPEGTPIGKLSQSLTYGARVLQIRDTYSVCAKLAEEMAKKHKFYLAGDYVFRREGQKSQAYEIIEQLYWKPPDYLICPIGCGTNLSAIWKGFKEYFELGFIDKLPKLIGVQTEGCATIVEAFSKKQPIKRWDKVNTICSAIAVNFPLDGNLVLNAIKESKGMAISVSDLEALEAEQQLGKEESIFVEPSGALPLAALNKLVKDKKIDNNSSVVLVMTGVGLKDPISALKNLPDPAVLDPEIEEIDRYIDLKLYNIRSALMNNKEDILWKKVPSDSKELQKIIKKEFNIDLQNIYLQKVYDNIKEFSEKNTQMRKADLQYIVENALKEHAFAEEVLKVLDFHLNVQMHDKPSASVKLRFKEEIFESEANGVGPVDAIINAIKNGIKGKDSLNFSLVDYNVEIDTPGTDAVVEVRIKMRDKFGNEVTGSGTSPDVIVASINAFTRGYNVLNARK